MPRRIQKLREVDTKELEVQQRELTEQIFRLRFQLTTGQAEAHKRLREARKDLARLAQPLERFRLARDLKSTRLNSRHVATSYAVFRANKTREYLADSAALN